MVAGNQGIDSMSLKDLKSKATALRKFRPPVSLTEPLERKGRSIDVHEPTAEMNPKDAETSSNSNFVVPGSVNERETPALEKK